MLSSKDVSTVGPRTVLGDLATLYHIFALSPQKRAKNVQKTLIIDSL